MAANEVTIKVGVDASDVDSGLRKVTDSVSHATDNASKSAGKLGGALSSVGNIASGFVVGAALTSLPNLLMDSAKAAAEDAASVALLQTAVENTGVSYGAYSDQLTKTIEQAQKMAFSDDQARASLSILTAQTGSAEEAQRRFAIAMDLSRGANIDVVTASRLLGKVSEENVSVLNRYGITVREGASDTELFGAIQEKFGGQSKAFAESTAGSMAIASIQIGELKEAFGVLLLPALTAATGVLNNALIPAMGFISDHADIVTAGIIGLATAITVFIIPATINYTKALLINAAAFVAANAPLIALSIGIGILVAAIIIVVKHWDEWGDTLKRLFPILYAVEKSIELVKNGIDALEKPLRKLASLLGLSSEESQKSAASTNELSASHERASKSAGVFSGAHNQASNATVEFAESVRRTTGELSALTSGAMAASIAMTILSAEARQSAEEQEVIYGGVIQRMTDLMKAMLRREKMVEDLTRSILDGARAELGILPQVAAATASVTSVERERTNGLKDQEKALNDIKHAQDRVIGSVTSRVSEVGISEDLRAFAADNVRIFGDLAGNTFGARPGQQPAGSFEILNPAVLFPDIAGKGPGASGNIVTINISGIVTDPVSVGRQVADVLNQASLSTGALVLSGAVQQ